MPAKDSATPATTTRRSRPPRSQVYQRAIEKAGSLDPQRCATRSPQTNLMTAYGPIRFNEKGQNVAKGMSVVQMQNGKPVVVYPPRARQGEVRLSDAGALSASLRATARRRRAQRLSRC